MNCTESREGIRDRSHLLVELLVDLLLQAVLLQLHLPHILLQQGQLPANPVPASSFMFRFSVLHTRRAHARNQPHMVSSVGVSGATVMRQPLQQRSMVRASAATLLFLIEVFGLCTNSS